MAAGGMIPLFIGIGVAVDMGRLAMAQNALQAATDEAALAGATAYGSSGSTTTGQNAAIQYFTQAVGLQASLLTNATPTATAAPGQFNSSTASNNVTVSATATMPTTFLGMAGLKTVSMKASSTAANPWGSAGNGNTWQPVISSGFLSSSAMDWNSLYVYAVPVQKDGTPNFGYIPPLSALYEVASDCSAATSSNYQSGAHCDNWPGHIAPTGQTFPTVQANQPLAVVMFNMTDGTRSDGGYGKNSYGSATGDMRLMASTMLTYGASTTWLNDLQSGNTPGTSPACTLKSGTTDWYVNDVWPQSSTPANAARPCDASSNYNAVNNSSTPNCALIIQQIDPAHPPALPPYSGTCFALNDPRAGLQYANLTCSQIAGRTFVYWFNDMGGPGDDKDYNDMVVSLTCNPVGASSNPGNFKSTGTAPTSTLTTALIQ